MDEKKWNDNNCHCPCLRFALYNYSMRPTTTKTKTTVSGGFEWIGMPVSSQHNKTMSIEHSTELKVSFKIALRNTVTCSVPRTHTHTYSKVNEQWAFSFWLARLTNATLHHQNVHCVFDCCLFRWMSMCCRFTLSLSLSPPCDGLG